MNVHILYHNKYSSKDFEGYLQWQGINHQVTAPYTSAKNGKAEWLHRTLFNRAQAIMSENKFPGKLCGECVCTAAYLRDHTPTRTLKDKTPYEAYYRSRPDISHLRELGCWAYTQTVRILAEDPQPLSGRSTCGILNELKSILVLLPKNRQN